MTSLAPRGTEAETRKAAARQGKVGRWSAAAARDARELAEEEEPMHVLLAEDDDDMRGLIGRVLRQEGFGVVEVTGGKDLLEHVGSMLLRGGGRSPFDLIVSDVKMPGRSGLEILRGLRRADWSTPMILITAFGDEALHLEADRLGAAAVFDKPFNVRDLRDLALTLVPW